jgi:hypothetical protein
MAKLIIYVTGRPLYYGFRRQEFAWDQTLGCYVWKAKQLSEKEFNEVAPKVLKNFADLHPMVRVTEFSEGIELPEPVATIAAHEITAEEAIEVLQRLAPEVLKKKVGRKPLTAVA